MDTDERRDVAPVGETLVPATQREAGPPSRKAPSSRLCPGGEVVLSRLDLAAVPVISVRREGLIRRCLVLEDPHLCRCIVGEGCIPVEVVLSDVEEDRTYGA